MKGVRVGGGGCDANERVKDEAEEEGVTVGVTAWE